MARRSIALVFALLLVISQVAVAAGRSAAGSPGVAGDLAAARVEKGLGERLDKGELKAFIVEFSATTDLAPAKKIKDRVARGTFVLNALTKTANASQKAAKALVKATRGARATGYWLTNVLVVEGDAELATKLAGLAGVSAVRAPRVYPLVKPVSTKVAILAAAGDPEWGVAKIGAPAAWADGVTGQGVVVANVDTGVDYLHPALVNSYRGSHGDGTFDNNCNRWDPTRICGDAPCDNAGHGTHTMGTMVGGDGSGPFTPDTGVAPGARWIAAKGCEDFFCTEQSLLSSGQFILAPTDLAGRNPNPAKRPDVVNNSWGGGPGDTFYLETVQAWRAAGIIPVFASGNPGPACGQGGSPGDFPEVLSAGATDKRDVIAAFSGRGPSSFEGKAWNPDIAAPGVDVVSSVPGGGYASFSGTSMAAPHTVGEIALVLSARPALIGDFDGVARAVSSTALDRIDTSCGAAPGGDPNSVYGDGRIDAKAAVDLVKTGGTLVGTVSSAEDASPIGGATVTAATAEREFRTVTAADGTYSMFLAAGDYGVSARAFGFETATAGSITITTDATTIQPFSLTPLPRFTVRGVVTASEDGTPIPDATVAALGVPVAPVTTDAAGAYALTLPIGSYTLRFSAGGCTASVTAEVVSNVTDVLEVNAALYRKLDDFGHGCRTIAFDWVDATSQTALYGDEFAGRLRLPFAFPFYGKSHEQIWLSDNGYLNFLGPDVYNGFPSSIPSSRPPNAAIYPLWQDLYLDDASEVAYAVVGSAPDRAFVIEYRGVRAWGSSSRLSFELKLWENGTIDLLYGNNAANPGDGRNALVGIENATGTDALEISFFGRNLGPNVAYRIEQVPSGLVRGTVTDANDGLPIAGTTITASPGGRQAATTADGTYTLRLRPGTYALEIASPPYRTVTRPATVTDGGDVTIDVALAGGIATVAPATITESVEFGVTKDVIVDLGNTGTAPVAWEAKERDLGVVPPPLPVPTVSVHRSPTWSRQAVPAGVPRIAAGGSGGLLMPIITDPAGDAVGSVDVTTVRGGSDGSATASLSLEFSGATPMGQVAGFVFLDTDQDPGTGMPPEALYGLPSQDIGAEHFVDLFSIHDRDPVALLVDANTWEIVATIPVAFDGQSFAFDMPLAALGGDDGTIDVAMVLGDFNQPTDWAPDSGHGTILPFTDLAWIDESPASGTVAPGDHQAITLTLGGATLAPGDYHGLVVLLTDAPKQRQVVIDVNLTVVLPELFGAIEGTATDAHTGDPLAGVAVSVAAQWQGRPLTLTTTTAADGGYRIIGPAGTWPATFTLTGFGDGTRDVTIVRAVTTRGVDVGLHRVQAHAALDTDAITAVITPGRTHTTTITLSNPAGHLPLTFSVKEIPLDQGVVAGTAARPSPVVGDSKARTAKGVYVTPSFSVPPALQGDGDVLASWPTGLSLPWGVGFTGNLILSDPQDVIDVTFTLAGERLWSFGLPWAGAWGGDMAFDAGRGLVWQVNVGGDNGIYGLDPRDGSVRATITGSPWTATSQRGLAYDQVADVFYIGGWNEGIVYRVAGPSHPTPGTTLGQCNAPDPAISGLAWNPAFGLLWEATNSESDSIYLLDPTTCEVLRSLPHPDGGGFNGAGLEIDAIGNLWTVGQSSRNAYLVESGLPLFGDVPWLAAEPIDGVVAPDGSQAIRVTVDSTGLEPGVHRAVLVIQTNDPDHGFIQVPVVLIVPAYQQGINTGGGSHVNANGDLFGPDRAWGAGPFGYLGTSSTRTTKSPIAATVEDPLYRDLRQGMTGYRFAVPPGRYRVDLGFAEIVARKVGARVFSVAIEGQAVLSSFDVLASAGGRNTALDRWFEVDVTDGYLDITFTAQRGDGSMVSSILVTEVPAGSPGR